MIERFLDERVGELGDDIRGKLRADGLEQEIAFFVVEVFVKVRKVRVVDVLGGGKQGGAIGRIQRPHQLTHGILVEFIRHARRLCGKVGAGKENEVLSGPHSIMAWPVLSILFAAAVIFFSL